MSKAVVKDNKIKCSRGPVADMNIIVKDKQGTEWYSKLTKEQFTKHDKAGETSVQVYDQAGLPAKMFRKAFLTFVSEFEIELRSKPTPTKNPMIDSVMHVDDYIDPSDIEQSLAETADHSADSEGTSIEDDPLEDSSQEEHLKEDQLHIVDPNEKDVAEDEDKQG